MMYRPMKRMTQLSLTGLLATSEAKFCIKALVDGKPWMYTGRP
jgi:hypothetical protein